MNPVIGPQARAPWRWVTVPSGPVIVIDASLGFHFRVAVTEACVLEPPQNGTSGQPIRIRFEQDATGHAVTTHSDIVGTAAVSTTASAITYTEMVYDDVAGRWGITATGLTQAQAALLYQPLDAELTALAGLVSAADRVPYFTGSGTAALNGFTTTGRQLAAVTDAAAARTVLGLGTAYAANIAAAQADSTAGDVATLKNDFNSLLAKLRTAGLLTP